MESCLWMFFKIVWFIIGACFFLFGIIYVGGIIWGILVSGRLGLIGQIFFILFCLFLFAPLILTFLASFKGEE